MLQPSQIVRLNMRNATMQKQQTGPREVLRSRDLSRILRRSRTSIWRDWKSGALPSPVRTGPNSIGWFRDEIEKYLSRLPRVSGKNSPLQSHPQSELRESGDEIARHLSALPRVGGMKAPGAT